MLNREKTSSVEGRHTEGRYQLERAGRREIEQQVDREQE